MELVVEALLRLAIPEGRLVAAVFAISREVAEPVAPNAATVIASERIVTTDELRPETATPTVVMEGLLICFADRRKVDAIALGGVVANIEISRIIEAGTVEFALAQREGAAFGAQQFCVGIGALFVAERLWVGASGAAIALVFSTIAVEVAITHVLGIDTHPVRTAEFVDITLDHSVCETAAAAFIVESLTRGLTGEIEAGTRVGVVVYIVYAGQVAVEAVRGTALAFDGFAAVGEGGHIVPTAALDAICALIGAAGPAVDFVALVDHVVR